MDTAKIIIRLRERAALRDGLAGTSLDLAAAAELERLAVAVAERDVALDRLTKTLIEEVNYSARAKL